MRTNVTFLHPAEYVPTSGDYGVLGTAGASWFADILRRVDGLAVDDAIVQEDWGVVIFGARSDCRFWVGLSFWNEGAWLAHVHHGSFAWVQRLTARGKRELERLALDLHAALRSDAHVQDVCWHLEPELQLPDTPGAARPDAA